MNLGSSRSQGASTITMQVARTFYLTRQKTYSRKLREIVLAYKIEQKLSKDQILELYMNQIYLGSRAYGFGSAARVYFGKPVQELTLAEAAMRNLRCASTVSRYFALLGAGVVAGFFALGFFADTERVSFHWPLPATWRCCRCCRPCWPPGRGAGGGGGARGRPRPPPRRRRGEGGGDPRRRRPGDGAGGRRAGRAPPARRARRAAARLGGAWTRW